MSEFAPDYLPAAVRPSPNYGERRNDVEPAASRVPDMIILHYTGMAHAQAALDWLCACESEVSSHYFVDEAGNVTQMVPERLRAWHAGASFWKGDADINSASIGIEIVNPGHEAGAPAYPPAQVSAVIALCRDIVARYGIAAERVLAHSDVAPGRKRDPGEWFPWKKLHESGVGHWVEPLPVAGGRFLQQGESGQPVEALQTMLGLYGYTCETDGSYGPGTVEAVRAFQRHFRPVRVDGVADASTIGTLHRLLTELPYIS